MRRIPLLFAVWRVFSAPTAFAQQPAVDRNGQITFNPTGLTPTGAIMLPPPPGYASVQIDIGNGQTRSAWAA